MVILAILYGMMFLIYMGIELLFIKKVKRLRPISFVRIMYAFVNGLLPCIVYLRVEAGDEKLITRLNTELEPTRVALLLLFSILGYVMLCLGYALADKQRRKKKKPLRIESRKVLRWTLVLMIVGFISLFLWTRAYGSIANFMRSAARIRSGNALIHNSFAFFKHFAKFMNFAFIVYVSYFLMHLVEKKGFRSSWRLLIPTVASVIGAFLFLLCSDSRGNFGAVVIMAGLSMFFIVCEKKKYPVEKQVLIIGVFAVVALVGVSLLSDVANIFRFDREYQGRSINVVDTITNEFVFTVRSQNAAMKAILADEWQSKFFDDLAGSLICWLPGELKPYTEPQDMWTYNTLLINGTSNTATNPTDLLAGSLYYFHLLGPILLCTLMGFVTRRTEMMINRIDNYLYRTILRSIFSFKLMNICSHYMLRSLLYENMALIVGVVLIHLMCRSDKQSLIRLRWRKQ